MKWITFILTVLSVYLSGCCPHKYCPDCNPPPLPPFCVPERIRIALVLGSGGVRGMAHVGVLEVLEEENIPFDLIVGCSAGSMVGALYADCPDSQFVKQAVKKLKATTLLDIDIWDCRFGLSQGLTFRQILDNNLVAESFEELKIPLVVVATDLNSGELVPIGGGELARAVQASCSIPFVFVPIQMHGRVLVDGGVINPVPVKVAHDLGADVVIAVDLCELLPQTFPTNLFAVASRSTEIAFRWQNKICVRNADVLIEPKLCGIGTFDDSKLRLIYQAGRDAAKEAIPRIRQAIAHVIHEKPCTKWKTVQLPPYSPF